MKLYWLFPLTLHCITLHYIILYYRKSQKKVLHLINNAIKAFVRFLNFFVPDRCDINDTSFWKSVSRPKYSQPWSQWALSFWLLHGCACARRKFYPHVKLMSRVPFYSCSVDLWQFCNIPRACLLNRPPVPAMDLKNNRSGLWRHMWETCRRLRRLCRKRSNNVARHYKTPVKSTLVARQKYSVARHSFMSRRTGIMLWLLHIYELQYIHFHSAYFCSVATYDIMFGVTRYIIKHPMKQPDLYYFETMQMALQA